MPVDPASLLALARLTAPPDDGTTPVAEPDQVVAATPSDGGDEPAHALGEVCTDVAPATPWSRVAASLGVLATDARTALHDVAALVLPESEASRRRTAVLAGASVAAGLLAGLLVPASAQADPPARVSLTVAAASPFTGIPRPTSSSSAAAPRAVGPVTATHPTAASVLGVPPAQRTRGGDSAPPPPGRARPFVLVSASVAGSAAYRATRPLPARSGTGRRIVYAERAAHLWIVGADGQVLRDYKVTGRVDRPKPGVYHVYSKSPTAVNPGERLTFDLMVRFAYGVTGARIGFHTIPRYYDGRPIQAEKDLGRAIGMGGCVRQSRTDAKWLYAWSRVGDTVVVVH